MHILHSRHSESYVSKHCRRDEVAFVFISRGDLTFYSLLGLKFCDLRVAP